MSPKESKGQADRELRAMGTILSALESLDGESVQRVVDYVLGRLSLSKTPRSVFISHSSQPLVASDVPTDKRQKSVRDLKDEKRPESANQMAALVAYYLSELAPEGERKDAVSSADIERYFKQAGFKLPAALHNTLTNATNSGYFDLAGRGVYRLNPVGYNLVVHGLPRSEQAASKRPRAKKAIKKPTVAKKR